LILTTIFCPLSPAPSSLTLSNSPTLDVPKLCRAGTLSVSNLVSAMKHLPEPSFLYSWLDMYDEAQMVYLLKRLFAEHPYLVNIQVKP
jgi:hypothetical protein